HTEPLDPAPNVVEYAIQRGRAERDDFRTRHESRGKRADIGFAHCAYIAHDLRDHYIGRELSNAVLADVVQRPSGIDEITDLDIDLTGCRLELKGAGRHDSTRRDSRRLVALVRHADETLDVAKRCNDLG